MLPQIYLQKEAPSVVIVEKYGEVRGCHKEEGLCSRLGRGSSFDKMFVLCGYTD